MLQLKVEAIRWEAKDTATFFLSEATGARVHYLAGQFITLVFDHHAEELRRSYSISSSPDEEWLSITIKRVPNGELSRFLLTHAKVGDIWNVVEPAGRFILTDGGSQPHDIFFFAAGSGITPILSQIKYLLNRRGNNKLTLIYSNRNTDSILFKKELHNLELQHPERLKIINLLSDDARRLNNVTAEQLVRQYAQHPLQAAQFYLCGPFDYMRMLKLTLGYMHFTPAQIRKENFVLDTVPVAGTKLNFPPRKIQLIFDGETYDLMAGENQSILQAALQNNIRIPYSCRVGICATCSAKCKTGSISMTANEVLTDGDIAEGWILTCTGYAIGDDVVVEI